MNKQQRLSAFVLAFIASLLVAVSSPGQAVAKDLNCDDFPNQAAAQNHLNNNPSDPDGLDSEGDGKACESLPCPCAGSQPQPQPTPTPQPQPQPQPQPTRTKAVVVKVLKGDAVKVQILPRGPKVGVQLLGAKSPGLSGCGGLDAKRSLKKMLPRRTPVWLTSDLAQPNRKAGRLFRYVNKVWGGKDVGRALIRQGWALEGDYAKKYTRERLYTSTERDAKSADKGTWGLC